MQNLERCNIKQIAQFERTQLTSPQRHWGQKGVPLTSDVTELMLVPSDSPFLRYMLTEGPSRLTGGGGRGP